MQVSAANKLTCAKLTNRVQGPAPGCQTVKKYYHNHSKNFIITPVS